jgi:hypothetical protein
MNAASALLTAPFATVAGCVENRSSTPGDDCPDVEVLWEGVWFPGEVRMVKWLDGAELHQVEYRRPGELSSHIHEFTASHLRADTVGRSHART